MIVVEHPREQACWLSSDLVGVLAQGILVKLVDGVTCGRRRWQRLAEAEAVERLMAVAPPGDAVRTHLYAAISVRMVAYTYVYLR